MRDNKSIISFDKTTHGSYTFTWVKHDKGYKLLGSDALDVVLSVKTPEGEIRIQPIPEDIDKIPPWIVAQGSKRIRCTPLSDQMLHRKFASLRLEENEILGFAQNYGLLGRHVALSKHGSPVIDTIGESVERWKKEIMDISSLLAVWDLVAERKVGELQQLVYWSTNKDSVCIKAVVKSTEHRGWPQVLPITKSSNLAPHRDWSYIISEEPLVSSYNQNTAELIDRWLLDETDESTLFIGPVYYYICREVNKHIRKRISPQVLPVRGNHVYLFPETLLDAMWLMFMSELTGERRMIRCSVCGRWAEQNNIRRKYCSDRCRKHAQRIRERKDDRSGL